MFLISPSWSSSLREYHLLTFYFLIFFQATSLTWHPLLSCNSCISCHLILNNFVLLHVFSSGITFCHNLCQFLPETTVLNYYHGTVPFLLNEGQEQTLFFSKWLCLIAVPFHIDSVMRFQFHHLIVEYSEVDGKVQLCRYPLNQWVFIKLTRTRFSMVQFRCISPPQH